MKKIDTRYFGEVEVDETRLIRFDEGLLGFEEYHEYAMIRFDEENDNLMCLQAVREPDLAFVVLNPFSAVPDYLPQPEEADLKALGIGDETPVNFVSIMLVKDDFANCTINLKCPIVINAETLKAKQVILNGDYSMRQPFVQMKGE